MVSRFHTPTCERYDCVFLPSKSYQKIKFNNLLLLKKIGQWPNKKARSNAGALEQDYWVIWQLSPYLKSYLQFVPVWQAPVDTI